MLGTNVNEAIESYRDTDYESFRGYERFQFLLREMTPQLAAAAWVLDIGCAKGEFIYLARERFPDIRYVGVEYAAELVERARAEPALAGAEFHTGDARDFELGATFDVVLMSGVLSIFDDIEAPLQRMVEHMRPGGHGFIFGGFTSADIDVLVRFRDNHRGSDTWESGWNMFSLATVRRTLEPWVDEFQTTPFEISIDLPARESPEKSYTLQTRERGRILVTGGNIVREMYLVRFRKGEGSRSA